jgi:hypothetical protein
MAIEFAKLIDTSASPRNELIKVGAPAQAALRGGCHTLHALSMP